MKAICNDLADEHAALDEIVKDLDEDTWQTVTPFDDWTIKDEISHLVYFDRTAYLSATDLDAFNKDLEIMIKGFANFDQLLRDINIEGNAMLSEKLLSKWRKGREMMLAAYLSLSPKDRLTWYGPPMSARSMVTGRIMETWAHGQDIADALKIKREGTDRLRHIAHIGVSTFGFSFLNRQMEIPDKKVRVELTGPKGDVWTWGPQECDNVVRGPAEDFCLVVTRRRHPADMRLETHGEVASQWIAIAQVFAGSVDEGPQPGERV
jgi:uncharacterized protein (TIGR03084 family)